MRIKVLYFADMEKDIGIHSETIMFEGHTIEDLISHLVKIHPILMKWKGKVAVAINTEYSDFAKLLKNGDTVAFIPPVQGG